MSARPRLAPKAASAAADRAAQCLRKDPRVRLVCLFGSSTDSERAEVGDVDLAVLCDPPVSMPELQKLRADLMAAVGADLDVVSLNHASVVLAWEVADSGRCLYASPRTSRRISSRGPDHATGISSRS